MSAMAIVIQADGNADIIMVKGDLESITDIVGGHIEAISPMIGAFGNWHGYVDEEGKLKNLPRNFVADDIANGLGWGGRVAGDFIVGPLLLLGDGPDGQEADVPTAVTQFVHDYYRDNGVVEMMTHE